MKHDMHKHCQEHLLKTNSTNDIICSTIIVTANYYCFSTHENEMQKIMKRATTPITNPEQNDKCSEFSSLIFFYVDLRHNKIQFRPQQEEGIVYIKAMKDYVVAFDLVIASQFTFLTVPLLSS
jgi:hypothetical protein